MICVIPARGGSKRIPRKNIKEFRGEPIITYSIQAAAGSGLFNRIIVSTEDEEIADVARIYGAEIHDRTASLAVDDPKVGTVAVVQEVARRFHFEKAICALYPCAPLVKGGDLRISFDWFMHCTNDYLYVVDQHSSTDQGQFYWGLHSTWRAGLRINHVDSYKMVIPGAIDINTHDDWARAEKLYEREYGVNSK